MGFQSFELETRELYEWTRPFNLKQKSHCLHEKGIQRVHGGGGHCASGSSLHKGPDSEALLTGRMIGKTVTLKTDSLESSSSLEVWAATCKLHAESSSGDSDGQLGVGAAYSTSHPSLDYGNTLESPGEIYFLNSPS